MATDAELEGSLRPPQQAPSAPAPPPPPPRSVRAAVAFWAVFVGGYSLVRASVYGWKPSHYQYQLWMQTSCGFAYLIVFVDFLLICSILSRDDKVLKWVLHPILGVYAVSELLSLCTFFSSIQYGYQDILAWEGGQAVLLFCHLFLMALLLLELNRALSPEGRARPPTQSWLKGNLARQDPAPPTDDKARLKDHEGRIGVSDSCVVLAPIHQPTAPAAFGPPSCSEA